jgi:MYXO-CTERM domain-containing protein
MSGLSFTSKSLPRAAVGFVAAVAALWSAAPAGASVILSFDDGDATPTVVTGVAPGTSFSVNLRLTSTGDQVSGVNYDFIARNAANQPVNNVFRLTARSLASPASAYPDTTGVLTDAQVAAANKLLAPDTQQNLGSTATSGTTGAGTFQVSRVTFQVPAGTLAGTYTINSQSPGNDPFVGYNGAGPTFADHPFDAQAVYTVTVTPEPGALALLGLVAPVALRRSRRA